MPDQPLATFLRRHITLRFAIILAVVFGMLVPASLLIPFHLHTIEQASRLKLHADHKRLTEILAVILSEPLWQITPEVATISSEVVFSDPRVAKIEVITLPDHKLFLQNQLRMQTMHGPFVTLTQKIQHGEQTIGELRLTLTEDLLIEELNADFKRYLSTSVLSLFFAVCFILIVLQWRLIHPIKLLMSESGKLAQGQLNQAIQLNRRDELGSLATSLEATRQALQGSFKQLEVKNQQLLEYSINLETKVWQRTQELENALSNIQDTQNELARVERMAALGSMVAGVAHELNTPLGNCLLVASTLQDEASHMLKIVEDGQLRRSDLSKFIQAANDSSQLLLRGLHQAARLVGDFKQVAVDQSSAQRREFYLHVMLDELAALLRSGLRKTHYSLTLDIPEDIVLQSFPGPLGQVFTNLVNNSVTHAFQDLHQGHMLCSAIKQPEHVLIIFEDDGRGIPAEIIQRIFEPFFTTKFGQGGSGLGLSITFNIVTNVLGGEIRASSMAGQGARFEIRLPLIAPSSPETNFPLIEKFSG